MEVIEIRVGDKSYERLEELYNEILLKAFPDGDELESLDNIRFYLNNAEKLRAIKCNYHILACIIGDKIVGGLIGDYYASCNSCLIEYIATDYNYRGMGVSKKMLEYFYSLQKKNAINNGKREIDYIFVECENPSKFNDNVNMIKRIQYWNHLKYYKLDFKYIQAALDKEKQSIDFLNLFCYVNNRSLGNEVSRENIFKFLHDFQKYSLGIKNPSNHKDFIKMLEENTEKKFKILLQ